jgi:hypothetical protein
MTEFFDRPRPIFHRPPLTKPQKVVAGVLGVVELVKFVVSAIRQRGIKPRPFPEHPLRAERIPVDAVRESGGMGVHRGSE